MAGEGRNPNTKQVNLSSKTRLAMSKGSSIPTETVTYRNHLTRRKAFSMLAVNVTRQCHQVIKTLKSLSIKFGPVSRLSFRDTASVLNLIDPL